MIVLFVTYLAAMLTAAVKTLSNATEQAIAQITPTDIQAWVNPDNFDKKVEKPTIFFSFGFKIQNAHFQMFILGCTYHSRPRLFLVRF